MTDLAADLDPRFVAEGPEQDLLSLACDSGTPALLLGPTGCGKTELVEQIARDRGRELITVTCHDDLTAADLVGRHLIRGGDVVWQDGPLTTAMRRGAFCYLDEVVESRSDTLAVLHSVADHRRTLYIDRLSERVQAEDGFQLLASYNPRAAGSPKQLKPALRQRFATIHMGYLRPEREALVLLSRARVTEEQAQELTRVAAALRGAAARDQHRRFDPPSTRTLVQAASLVAVGASVADAIEIAVVAPLSVDDAVTAALRELVAATRGTGEPAASTA